MKSDSRPIEPDDDAERLVAGLSAAVEHDLWRPNKVRVVTPWIVTGIVFASLLATVVGSRAAFTASVVSSAPRVSTALPRPTRLVLAGQSAPAVAQALAEGASQQLAPTTSLEDGAVFLPLAQLYPGAFGGHVLALAISGTRSRADSAQVFPVGTDRVFAVYDYAGFGWGRVVIEISAPGIPNVYRSPAKRHLGDGTGATQIAGADILTGLTDFMHEDSLLTRSNIQLARTHTPNYGYLALITESTMRIDVYVTLLATIGDHGALADEQVEQIATVKDSAEQIHSLAQEALALPPGDSEAKRALADQMEPHLLPLVGSAESLTTFAATVSDIMFPETGPEQDGYIVVAVIEGYPHSSTEFSIAGSLEDEG